jgi:hypothetical protein
MADLTGQQARAVNSPWYSLFNIATRGDVRAVQETVLTRGLRILRRLSTGPMLGPRDVDQGGLELREHDPGPEIRDQGKCWSPAIA